LDLLSRLDCIALQSLTQVNKWLFGYLPLTLAKYRFRLKIASYASAIDARNFGQLCHVLDRAREMQLPEILWGKWVTDVDPRVARAALHSLRAAAHPKWVRAPLPLASRPLCRPLSSAAGQP